MKNKSERILATKHRKFVDQGGRCAFCGELFKVSDVMELAHVIPQRKYLIKLYGEDIIHHELNMKLTHTGRCNSGVQISPNKTKVVEELVSNIRKAIEEEK